MAIPTQPAIIHAARTLAPGVREFALAPRGAPLRFAPGQWISLHLPLGERPPLMRAYSLAEPEASSGELVLCFDLVAGGRGSGYLHTLEVGNELTVAGPFGSFRAPDPLDQDLVLVARFTGIVPVRCILKAIFAGARAPEALPAITLVYGAASREQLIYHDELAGMAARLPRFRYLPTALDGAGGPGIDDRPEIEILAGLARDWGGRRDFVPMVSGVRALVGPVRAFFDALGFERRAVRRETYD